MERFLIICELGDSSLKMHHRNSAAEAVTLAKSMRGQYPHIDIYVEAENNHWVPYLKIS